MAYGEKGTVDMGILPQAGDDAKPQSPAMKEFPEYAKGLILLATGGTVSLESIVRDGSLVMTVIGAIFAAIGGYWMMIASRHRSIEAKHKAEAAELEVRIKEMELQNRLDNS